MNYVSAFLTSIHNAGITPKSTKDLIPSDRFKRIASSTDKGGKRSISYWLRIEHDFAYGYAKDFKTGFECRFKGYENGLTSSDQKRIKSLIKARQAEQEALIAEKHAKMAARAKDVWERAKTGGTTPYLIKKGIAIGNARRNDDVLIIPIHKDEELVNWQIIRANGTKKFPFGGEKQGCYSVLGTIDPTKPIYICEGWATGRSIQDAVSDNVIVAFDAYNLTPVAKNLRKKYQNAHIIIAADNDESRVGQEQAHKAAKAINNCSVKYPHKTNTDFNDLDAESIRSILCPPANPPVGVVDDPHHNVQASGGDGDWRGMLIVDTKGRVVSSSLKNAILYLQYHEDLKGVFCFDEFKQSILMKRCPPWVEPTKFKVEKMSDIDIAKCVAYLEDHGIATSKDRAAMAIQVSADENKFHSAQGYFKNLVWDGKPRLATMFKDHFGCKSENPEYLSWVATKWMTAAVKRIFKPGCKFDHVLVMESNIQGVAKSETLKTLVTFGDEEETYHTDAISVNDCTSQYTPLKMQGVMIVELAELKGFSKQDDESIKNWITQTIDEVKLPFDRMVSKFRRQFVFAATTNRHDYLKDPTGNRRYWPITIEKIIDMKKLAAERSQLWAEAYKNYLDDMYIGPTPEENRMADLEREKRMSHDAWTDIVMNIVERIGLDEFKTSQVLEKMDLKLMDKNENAQRRITNVLQMNGFENRAVWNPNLKKTVRLWAKKDSEQ